MQIHKCSKNKCVILIENYCYSKERVHQIIISNRSPPQNESRKLWLKKVFNEAPYKLCNS